MSKSFREFLAELSLEEYRLKALDVLQRNIVELKQEAEQVLSLHIQKVKPIGSITNPTKFNEHSDVDVAFYVNEPGEVDEELSNKLQQYFIGHPLPTIGVINTLVFR